MSTIEISIKEEDNSNKKEETTYTRKSSISYRRTKKKGIHKSSRCSIAHKDMATRHIINTISTYLRSEADLVYSSSPTEVIKLIERFGLLESVYDLVDELKTRV